jgi:hypothetical protein
MRTNDRGIAVPGEWVEMPLTCSDDITLPAITDATDGIVCDVMIAGDFGKFLTVAANFHERMADIVRRLAIWNTGSLTDRDSLYKAGDDAAALWAEYQKEVQP